MMLHAAFQPEHDVEVAQPDVGVDQRDRRAALRQRRAEIGGRRRLADAAFARRDDDCAAELRGRRRPRPSLGLRCGLEFVHRLSRFHGADQAAEEALARRSS